MQIIFFSLEQSPLVRRLSYSCILIFLCQLVLAETFDAQKNRLDRESAQTRLAQIGDDVFLPFTSETERLLDVYTYSYIPGARRIVERTEVYFPQYDYKLNQLGLPKVLKNLAVVESNMDPWTFSSRGAAGPWQIMKYTARAHGLNMDRYVDERFDPVMASQVAFDYLKELHTEFENWDLTLVAYNYGPTALRKAMKYCDSRDLEVLREALPKESMRYASRLAAAAYLNDYYAEHGIRPKLRLYKSNLASIDVYEYITFDEIASYTGLSRQEIVELNPAVIYDYLPTNELGYTLNLPLEEMTALVTSRGWSYSDIHDLEYHIDQLERKISFYHSPYSEISKDDKEEDNKSDDEDESDQDDKQSAQALRREQVLHVKRLG